MVGISSGIEYPTVGFLLVVRGGQMGHLLVNWLKFTYKCLIIHFFSIFMGMAILASAFIVLELGALVIYDN